MASSGISLGVALRGQQDVYIMSQKGNSFFTGSYPRHTNFGMGEIAQSFDTTPQLGRANIQTTLTRAGDLLGEVYLQFTLKPISYRSTDMVVSDAENAKTDSGNVFAHYTNGAGYAVLNSVSVRIGQHEFDKHTGEIMFLRDQLSNKSDRQLTESVGYLVDSPNQHVALAHAALVPQIMTVPMQFWFCTNVEQALPMISLYWHDVMVYLDLKSMQDLVEQSIAFQALVTAGSESLPAGPDDFQWLGNFYFLDRMERSMVANQKTEIVFSQVQYFGDVTVSAAATSLSMPIRFNHPVVDLTFVLQRASATGAIQGVNGTFSNVTTGNNQWLNFDGPEFIASGAYAAATAGATFTVPVTSLVFLSAEPAVSLQIFLNNQARTEVLPWKFMRECIPSRNYTRIPREAKCAVYSFGIDADNMLSTGTVNFSRLDTAEARITLWGSSARTGYGSGVITSTNPVTVTPNASLGWNGRAMCYARNFNLTKISLGMMGVKFAA